MKIIPVIVIRITDYVNYRLCNRRQVRFYIFFQFQSAIYSNICP